MSPEESHRDGHVDIHGDIQDWTGHCPEKHDAVSPVLNGALD